MCALKERLSTAKGADMPAPQPVQLHKQQFVRIMRLAALFSIGIAAVAVILVVRGDSETRAPMLIAVALGAGFVALLGIALMSLAILGGRPAHGGNAVDHIQKEEHDHRS